MDVMCVLLFSSWCCDFQVTVAYNKDPSPVKVNLGVGAYRTEVSIRSLCKVEGIGLDVGIFI